MPNTIDFICPVCLTESLDDYNVTKECWVEAGFTPKSYKESLYNHNVDPANWWKQGEGALTLDGGAGNSCTIGTPTSPA